MKRYTHPRFSRAPETRLRGRIESYLSQAGEKIRCAVNCVCLANLPVPERDAILRYLYDASDFVRKARAQ